MNRRQSLMTLGSMFILPQLPNIKCSKPEPLKCIRKLEKRLFANIIQKTNVLGYDRHMSLRHFDYIDKNIHCTTFCSSIAWQEKHTLNERWDVIDRAFQLLERSIIRHINNATTSQSYIQNWKLMRDYRLKNYDGYTLEVTLATRQELQ